jgi:hypothetical protein
MGANLQMKTLYRITGWNDHFENNRTRDLKRMTFACIPNKQDGDGYTELLDHVDGPAHYGAWIALVLVASKGDKEKRGVLVRDNGEPHDPKSLQRMTRIPVAIWNQVLPRLCVIGWLSPEILGPECDTATPENPAPDCGNPAPTCGDPSEHSAPTCVPHAGAGARAQKGREGNGTEGKGENGTEQKDPPAASPPSPSKASPVDRSEDVRRVFEHYRARFPKRFPRVHSDLKEWGLVRDRIDGNGRSPYHQGQNDQKRAYDSLELIVRDTKHVQDFMAVPARAGPVLSKKTQATFNAINNLLAQEFGDDDQHEETDEDGSR